MRQKILSEDNIIAIDDHAPSMMDIPGVLQVFAGYGRLMNRYPEISPDGSLVLLVDVADTFMRRCVDVFNVEKFPCAYAACRPPPDKIEKLDRKSGYALAKRSVIRIRIDKFGSFLSSGYRVTLYLTVGGSIVRITEYDASSPPDIFSSLQKALR